MGTEFSEIARPWSSLRYSTNGHHHRLTFFIAGKQSGELVFGPEQEEELREAIYLQQGDTVAKQSSTKDGLIITHFKKPRTRQVISEYGEILSVEEIGYICDSITGEFVRARN